MSIQEVYGKFKAFIADSELLLVIIIIATGLGGFVLGKSSNRSFESNATLNHEVRNQKAEIIETATETSEVATNAQYVASKNGTKYHLTWCAGAKQIKEENKVYFETKEEAERAGYSPAANCKGI